jgi:transferase family hexapeptide repeat protein
METIRHTNPDGSAVEVTLGRGVTLGHYVTLGDRVRLGDGVRLGENVRLGRGVRLGDDVTLGHYVTLGDDVTLGDGVTLGHGVTIERPEDFISGVGRYAWSAHRGALQYGCETRPIEAWTPELQARLCVQHDSAAAEQLARLVRAVRAYFSIAD